MEIIHSPAEMQRRMQDLRREGKTTSFVPTMGFLHEGHLSLIRLARSAADVLIVSIFVNPAQFTPFEDFGKYPRDIKRDRELCEKAGVDILFIPPLEDMYPPGYSTYVEETRLSRGLCGQSRPGHFRGVTTIVVKLFCLLNPEVAFFGQKDYQQMLVISKMVQDLNLPVRIETGPIIRGKDGLALSSRNVYLSPEERKQARCLYRSLCQAEEMVKEGERDAGRIKDTLARMIREEPSARIDYIEIRDGKNLKPVDKVKNLTLIALAVFIGKIRLIDNILIQLPGQV